MASKIKLRSLILTGGRSTRMGSAKHLLQFPVNGREATILELLLDVHQSLATHQTLHTDVSWEPPVYISVCDENQRSDMLNLLAETAQIENTRVIVDTKPDAGPTSGLLAAHSTDPTTHYLITGCDYPMLTTDALLQLLNGHVARRPAVTCFVNENGWTEPLLAVWTPAALSALYQTTFLSETSVGPNRVVQLLESFRAGERSEPYSAGVLKVRPLLSSWISNVNTPEEYQRMRRPDNHNSGVSMNL